MPKRNYEVSGTGEAGDVHTFASEDRERAEEKLIMRQDLEEVELKEVTF